MESSHSQFSLLKTRRFLPLFLTQFLGAFNDNVFKNAFMIMIAFYGVNQFSLDANILINFAAGVFILPFFLFSATAGQLADKYEKSLLVRRIKTAEIFIMCIGGYAFISENLILLFGVLFLMGTQSVFFGPIKYAVLPQHLEEQELVGGNAQIEMGTFVAILLGTIVGGILPGIGNAAYALGGLLLLVSILGFLTSRSIPEAPSKDPDLVINKNPFSETIKLIRMAKSNTSIFLSILGVSWFWLLGASYLTQMPIFAKDILAGNNTVVSLLLCVFTIGIATGSLLCEKLSGNKIEIGLVPFGALGLSFFGIDLFFASNHLPQAEPIDYLVLLLDTSYYRMLFDFMMLGLSGGIYIVPLYAMIQQRSEESQRARVIAVNNIMNALFMVVAALGGAFLLSVIKITLPQFFLVIALMNIVVCLFIFKQVPEFTMRFAIWLLSHTMYRVKHENLDLIPDEGAAIIVCNHVSYVDAMLLAGAVRRPIRFIMFKPIYDIPVLNFIFRTGRAIPIDSQHVNKAAYEEAFKEIEAGLMAGDLLCIFPEGKLTKTGEINEFKTGIERMLAKTPVPVVPMAIRGLWGSFFSHDGGNAFSTLPKRVWSKIEIAASQPIEPEQATADRLYQLVSELRGETNA